MVYLGQAQVLRFMAMLKTSGNEKRRRNQTCVKVFQRRKDLLIIMIIVLLCGLSAGQT